MERKQHFCAKHWIQISLILTFVAIVPAGAIVAPFIEWQNHYDGGGEEGEIYWQYNPNAVIPSGNGGYFIVTTSMTSSPESHNSPTSRTPTEDVLLLKLDSIGNLSWKKFLGGTSDEEGAGIAPAGNGGCTIVGVASSSNGDLAGIDTKKGGLWVVKLGPDGSFSWQKSFGGSSGEIGRNIRQLPDGGYVIIGDTQSDDGDVTGIHGCYVWDTEEDASGSPKIIVEKDAKQCKPGIVSPVVMHFPDIWVVRLDASGNLLWQRTLGGTYADRGWSIRPTSDGGYILAGSTASPDGDVLGYNGGENQINENDYAKDDAWIVKLDPDGNIEWEKSLGGSTMDIAFDIIQTDDAGYIFVGNAASRDGDVTTSHNSGRGDTDMWIVGLDTSGKILWQKTFGGSSSDEGRSIERTDDGNYLIVGDTQSKDGDVSGVAGSKDLWVIKIDPSGTILWQKIIAGPNGGTHNEYGSHGIQTPDRGYLITGSTRSHNRPESTKKSDVFVVKLSGDGSVPMIQNASGANGSASRVSGDESHQDLPLKTPPTPKSPLHEDVAIIGVMAVGFCGYLKKENEK